MVSFAVSQLESYGIAHHNCVYHAQYKLPTSCVVLNLTSGSRTIVHYRNLPELVLEDFVKVDLSPFSWIHFEVHAILALFPAPEKRACNTRSERATLKSWVGPGNNTRYIEHGMIIEFPPLVSRDYTVLVLHISLHAGKESIRVFQDGGTHS